MKKILILAALLALPALAQVQPPRPFPNPIPGGNPFPPFPGQWPGQWPGNDPFPQDQCWGLDYDSVVAKTKKNCEVKNESWGAERNVTCNTKKLSLDFCESQCVSADGSKFARLRMYMNVTCGRRWGNSSYLRLTKILYY